MNQLKEIILSICFAAVAVGVIEMLAPQNNFKNPIRLVTGVVLILSIASPFFKPIDFDFEDFTLNQSYNVTQSLEKSVAMSAKESISQILSEEGIYKARIIINMDRNADNCIEIKGAEILFLKNDLQRAENVVIKIENQTGIDIFMGELT